MFLHIKIAYCTYCFLNNLQRRNVFRFIDSSLSEVEVIAKPVESEQESKGSVNRNQRKFGSSVFRKSSRIVYKVEVIQC